MKAINKIFYKSVFLSVLIFNVQADSKVLSMGSSNADVVVKVFSSLTCPHCANFHNEIFNKLQKDFIDQGSVRFEHHAFPLDLAALNAEIIIRCDVDNVKRFTLLDKMYEKQNIWAKGSDINKINVSIKKIGSELGLGNLKMEECLQSEKLQDDILNQRIDAQKKYKIESTPTIMINEKKYSGKAIYKDFKKVIEKNL